MRILQGPQKTIRKLLKSNTVTLPSFRKYTFCDEYRVSRGILLFHFVTDEVLLLEGGDFIGNCVPDAFDIAALEPSCAEYLIDHGFIVSEQNEDSQGVDHIRQIMIAMERLKADEMNAFTILTTTDCNARCFYCYEKGIAKIKMDEKTANDVADYILKNSKNPKAVIRLSWFGGEPLYNDKAIDIICERLTEAGRAFTSTMVSNGLLLNEAMLAKAVKLWRLNSIQITLDGTERIYNKTKAYIGGVSNAYQTVLANIGGALTAGIRVSIRMNVSEYNIDDLNRLADELAERFPGQALSAYAYLLFQYDQDGKSELKKELEAQMQSLMDKLTHLGLAGSEETAETIENPLNQGKLFIRLHQCMADNPASIVIMPDGRLHSCEHINANETWGSIYTGESKFTPCHTASSGEGLVSPLRYWEESLFTDECRKCKIYPFCIKLKHCPNLTVNCNAVFKRHIMNKVKAVEQYFITEAEK